MHFMRIKAECIKRAKYFRCLIFPNHIKSTATLALIYKAVCRPILEYGTAALANTNSKNINIIEVAERSALRSITKIRHPNNPLHNPPNHLLYELTEIEPIGDRLHRLRRTFFLKDDTTKILEQLTLKRPDKSSRFKKPSKTLWECLQEHHNEPHIVQQPTM